MHIRFLIESCLDIYFCATLQYIFLYNSETGKGMVWDSPFNVVNNLTFILLSSATLALPLFIIVFYCARFHEWKKEHFEERFGAAIEGLKLNRRSSVAYPVIFIVRRIILVFCVTVARNWLWVQLPVMVLVSMVQVAYLTSYKPQQVALQFKLDVLNEVTTIVLVDMLVLMTEANQSPFDFETDVAFLLILFGNISVHLFFLMKNTVQSTVITCKKKKLCCFRQKKLGEAAVIRKR